MAAENNAQALGLHEQGDEGPPVETTKISQAYSFYRMIQEQSDSDYAGSEGYEFSSDDFSSDDDMLLPDEDEEEIVEPDETPNIKLRKIGFFDKLVHPNRLGISDENLDACSNAVLRDTLWVVEPDFQLMSCDMGILSQIALLCVEAEIQACEHTLCNEKSRDMSLKAPKCDWPAFQEWAITAMSCQAAMNSQEGLSRAHSHIANAVNGCCMIIKKCLRKPFQQTHFRPFLDGEEGHVINLRSVLDVIHWMTMIQREMEIGPRNFGRWTHLSIPSAITLPDIEIANYEAGKLGICKTRLWNLVNTSDRKQSDLPAIVRELQGQNSSISRHEGHEHCTSSKCQLSHMDATSVEQLHKCVNSQKPTSDCNTMQFPLELLETALEQGKSTAWKCTTRKLSVPQDEYLAISHVWSDGTGAGKAGPGKVNACLFKYFTDIATQLGCNAIWWDVLSVPLEPTARSKALSRMHLNYADAKYTVVHDKHLLEVPWKKDGSPCLALVLSNWFTRGWTALELAKSKKVKIVFQDPGNGEPLIKDLDQDVLAKSPDGASRAWWLATTLIKQLRKPVTDVSDLISTLSTRSTSWVRDRTIIAALLAGVPDCDFKAEESIIVTKILQYLDKIPYACLFHGKATMHKLGRFSWCPTILDDMPVEAAKDMQGRPDTGSKNVQSTYNSQSPTFLTLDEAGAVEGTWWCRELKEEDIRDSKLRPYGNDLAVVVKIEVALRHWESCLLMRPPEISAAPVALLAVPFQTVLLKRGPVLKCRYVGTVIEDVEKKQVNIDDEDSPWIDYNVRIGGSDSGKKWKEGLDALVEMGDLEHKDERDDANSDTERDDEGEDESPIPLPFLGKACQNQTPKWLERDDSPGSPSSSYPNPLPIYREAHSSDILTAVKRKDKEAMKYLIGHGITFDAEDKGDFLHKVHSAQEFAGITMLGDVLTEIGNHEEAMAMYQAAIDGYEKFPPRSHMSILIACRAKYAMGKASLRYRGSLNEAETLFRNVLSQCKGKKKRKKARRTLRRAGAAVISSGIESQTTQPALDSTVKHSTDASSSGPRTTSSQSGNETGDNTQRRDKEWYRLELKTIGQLTCLYAGKLQFGDAAEAYKRSLEGFGKRPQGNEVFQNGWTYRLSQPFEHNRDRDETVSLVYHKALKRFQMLFHKDNLIVLLTALHLGVNLTLRSGFQEAKELLLQAEKGFRKHAKGGKDALLGLTQYHLGILYMELNKQKEAQEALSQVDLNFPADDDHWLRMAAICALGQNNLLFDQPKLDDAEKDFRKVIGHCRSQLTERKSLSTIQATLGLAKVHYKSTGGIKKAKKTCRLTLNLIKQAKDRKPDGEIGVTRDTPTSVLKYTQEECEARAILGEIYEDGKKLAEAEKEVQMALDGFVYLNGQESLRSLSCKKQLSGICGKRNDKGKAQGLLLETFEGYEKVLGKHHAQTLKTSWELGRLYLAAQKLDLAELYCARAHQGLEQTKKSSSHWVSDTAKTLGKVYQESDKLEQAKKMFSKVHAIMRQNPEVDAVTKAKSAMDLAMVSAMFDGYEDTNYAVKLYQEAIEGFKSSKKTDSSLSLDAQVRLADLYRKKGKFSDANQLIKDSLASYGTRTENFPTSDELRVKILEAELVLQHLRLDSNGTYNYDGDDGACSDEPVDAIAKIRDKLEGIPGNSDELTRVTLQASTILGQVYLDDETKVDDGESILQEVLKRHQSSKLSHPKAIRIMNYLINHFNKFQARQDEVQEMKKRMWEALKQKHGRDLAAVIMYMTNPKLVAHKPDEYEADGDECGETNPGEDAEDTEVWSDEEVSSWDKDESDSDEEDDDSIDIGSICSSNDSVGSEENSRQLTEFAGDVTEGRSDQLSKDSNEGPLEEGDRNENGSGSFGQRHTDTSEHIRDDDNSRLGEEERNDPDKNKGDESGQRDTEASDDIENNDDSQPSKEDRNDFGGNGSSTFEQQFAEKNEKTKANDDIESTEENRNDSEENVIDGFEQQYKIMSDYTEDENRSEPEQRDGNDSDKNGISNFVQGRTRTSGGSGSELGETDGNNSEENGNDNFEQWHTKSRERFQDDDDSNPGYRNGNPGDGDDNSGDRNGDPGERDGSLEDRDSNFRGGDCNLGDRNGNDPEDGDGNPGAWDSS
ncbi:MAG: hypothetical protein M1821_000631 [Bathelium mastoideum]|nr:MAG: hypothetical protein M1821_000631 [Bathelium mastoideum]